MTETIVLAAILIPCLVIAIVFHEVAHGWAALALGDPTAKERRRLSLNPIRHVDPVGTLIVPGALALFGGPVFGWAKPVPVNARRLDNPRYGMMAVAAAGPATNFVLAAIGAVALGFIAPTGVQIVATATGLDLLVDPNGSVHYLASGVFYFILINVFLGIFNLLPIPPFDGSHIVAGLLPRSMAAQYAKLQQIGMFLLIALIAMTWAFPNSGIIEHVVGLPVNWALAHYLLLTDAIAGG